MTAPHVLDEVPEGGARRPVLDPAVVETAGPAPLVVRRRGGRRVSTDPVPGSDPAPAPEPPRHASGENDRQLRDDVPPHWG
ncbi:hypothetical protein [Frigoribacterium sp. VKM Ac-2530]|uniref:hypothetical protein n=1 Tax=Frigoribacterium sp. VKM Ac-2530 TaxID=2783822 RepID=UPI001889D180|nr:hypothetical protein [Frigoribacterium sp. VKM Ac-2530]MBF4580130.1 hypothetical protein [Frigoribacterium sp. VKM Ac-2530]